MFTRILLLIVFLLSLSAFTINPTDLSLTSNEEAKGLATEIKQMQENQAEMVGAIQELSKQLKAERSKRCI